MEEETIAGHWDANRSRFCDFVKAGFQNRWIIDSAYQFILVCWFSWSLELTRDKWKGKFRHRNDSREIQNWCHHRWHEIKSKPLAGRVFRALVEQRCKNLGFPIRARNHEPKVEVSGIPVITRHSLNGQLRWTDSYRISDARIRWRCVSSSTRISREAGRRNLKGRSDGLFPIFGSDDCDWGEGKRIEFLIDFLSACFESFASIRFEGPNYCLDMEIHSKICNRRT